MGEIFDAIAAVHPAPRPNPPGPLMWYGGKGRMRAKLKPLLDIGMHGYIEPYCGGASLFFAKEPAAHEVLNDLHGEIVNFFRVLQDPAAAARLMERLAATPYARDEFAKALAVGEDADPETRAWAMFVRQNQGFSGKATSVGDWGRGFESHNGLTEKVWTWRTRVLRLPQQAERLSRAMIESRCALKCIQYWQTPHTLLYVDPPYPAATRVKANDDYRHECDDDHHRQLVQLLLTVEAPVVLSSYPSDLYQPLADAGWKRLTFKTACHAAGRTRNSGLQGKGAALAKAPRTEVVWLSPNHPATWT